MSQLSHEQRLSIVEASLAATKRGDHEEAHRQIIKLPMPPHLAMAYKNTFGVEELLLSDYDLSEAEKVYGKNWLAQ